MKSLAYGINEIKKLGCPEIVLKVISDFVVLLTNEMEHQRIGVLLVGSASRGEFSWQEADGKIHVFSDIEFLVAVEKKDSDVADRIYKKVELIEARANLGEFFHVDYTFIEWNKLKKLDTKFFIFESKCMGVDFCDRKVAEELPLVTKDNLLWNELNEILIHRLSSILHSLPISLINGKVEKSEEQKLCLNLAKNVLDVTTWLHPYEAEKLTAGYGGRLEAWESENYEKTVLFTYINKKDVEFIRQCLRLRKSPFSNINAIDMLRETLGLYAKAIAYMKYINHLDKTGDIDSFNVSLCLFDEYRLRQRVSQGISLAKNFKHFGVLRCLKNAFSVRRGFAASFCLLMLESYLNEINNQTGDGVLDKARALLRRKINVIESGSSEFESVWSGTRECFYRYQKITRNY